MYEKIHVYTNCILDAVKPVVFKVGDACNDQVDIIEAGADERAGV